MGSTSEGWYWHGRQCPQSPDATHHGASWSGSAKSTARRITVESAPDDEDMQPPELGENIKGQIAKLLKIPSKTLPQQGDLWEALTDFAFAERLQVHAPRPPLFERCLIPTRILLCPPQ